MLLRQTRPEDLDGVIGLEQCENTEPWLGTTGRGWHLKAIDDPDVSHLVFVKAHRGLDSEDSSDEELVGFVVLAGLSKPGPIEMRRMVINLIQRGKGYGRQLLNETIKLVQDMPDRDRIWLDVNPANEPAVALYESVGFEECAVPEGVTPTEGLIYLDFEL